MDNGNNQFMLRLIALLNQQKSRKEINSDIKELEKVINKIKLIATLAKGSSKTEINQAIKQLETQLKQIKLQAKMDKRQLNREINSALRNVSARDINLNINERRLNTQVRRVVSRVRSYVDSNHISVNIDLKKEKLLNQLSTFMNKNTRINESTYWLNEAERIRTVISSINNRTDLRNATDQLQVFTSGVRATGYATLSTTDRIKGMLGNIVKVGNYFGIAYIAINKFKESLKNLKEMDTIFTEISKTTDLKIKKLEELAEASYKIASKYGVLASNFATSLQEMSRAGFGDEQATALAELATMAQSAGALTSDLANQYLIASNAAYGYQGNVEKLNALLDSQNQVTNRNAVSMEELAEATKVAANQLSNSNISEAEMTALLGTGIATTQEEGSVVGRAVKGIVMNLQQVKNTDEGFETTEEDLGKVESRLASLEIQMKETANGITALRNPVEILKELADAYNALPENSAERANIISDIGGKYRGNVLSSILSNWSTYSKMLSDYADAEGSALRESQKSADSWEGRLAQLQNSWDSFVSSVTSKNSIKGGISFLDNTIQGFEKLSDTIGAIPVILTTINTSMAALNKNYGITQLFNKSTGKIDVQGSFMGMDITSWKAQTKHFSEASSAFRAWNQDLVDGTANINTFGGSVVQNNAQLKEYLQTTSKDAPASLNGYKAYLNAAGVSTDALRLKTVLLTSAITMGLSLGIQALITGISKLSNVQEEARQKAQELGEAFSSTESDIEGYKEKIIELYETINDSGASIEDTTAARESLMAVQDELIEKFGTEKETIELITDAINGQSDALDVLTKKQWQAIKNEFNESGMWNNIGNFLSGYSDNIDRMLGEYEEYTARLDMSIFSKTGKWNGEDTTKALKELERIGITINTTETGVPFADLSGDATEVYNKLLEIQNLFSDESLEASSSFQSHLTSLANSAEEVSSQYEDLYKQYVLYEKIFSDDTYTKSFMQINDAYSDYQDAFTSGNEESIKKTQENFASILTQATEGASDDSVIDYFNSMYPDLQELVSQWQFEINFTANTNMLKYVVERCLTNLDELYEYDLLNFSYETATDEQKEAYDGLISVARLYGLTIDQLIEKLIAMGLVQDEDYQKLVDLFGKTNVDSLSKEDLKIAYTIENVGNMSFEELLVAIQTVKDETVSFTEALSQINAFSEGLDQLGEIYADVKDKENFDFTSLLTDDFKETFGGFTEEYENLVKTITESPNDINACQDAFNSLATAYIYSTDALKNVTDETKNSTVALLKQMGVSNALDVVNNQLAINTSSLEKAQSNLNEAKKQGLTASVDLENATASELIKIMEESEQLGINIDDLYYYTLQKLQANEINIVTDGDLDALASLCDGLGVATTALKRYEEVKGRMSSLDSEYANRDKDSNYYARQKKILAEYDALENEMSKSASKILANKVRNKYKPTTTVKYTGSTDKDSSKDSSKDSTETFDWIENKLKAISNEIDTLDTKAGATWDSWANRNKALSQELGKVTEQIKIQEKAADKYLSLFNGVDISDAYRKKIMNGEMNIEEITNEELADKIKKAQEYWDNYITNKNDANEGRNTLASKVKEQFDNLKSESQANIDAIESQIDKLNDNMDIAETKGYYITEDYYNNLINKENDKISALTRQAKTLQDQLDSAVSNGIKKGSEDWQSMKDEIDGVIDEINETKKSIIELQVEIAKTNFENIQTKAENFKNAIEHEIQIIESGMNLRETIGKKVSGDSYDSIELLSLSKKANLEQEISDLYTGLKKFEVGTQNYEDALQEIREKEEELAQLEVDIAQNTIDRFNNEMEKASSYDRAEEVGLNHKLNSQSTAMELKELNGQLVTSSDYDALNNYQKRMSNNLQDQYNQMVSALEEAISRGEIKIGDDNWIQAWEDIYAKEEEIAESNKTIAQNTKEGVSVDISNVQNGYDKIQNSYSRQSSMIQNIIDSIEAKGYKATQELYEGMILSAEQSISAYRSERNNLQNLLKNGLADGSIAIGDDNYWSITEALNEIDESILQADNDIIEFNNSINKLKWDSFDDLMNKITDITEEANFLNSLLDEDDLFDDNGNLTKEGLTSAAMHMTNIETYKSQADEYADEILKLNKQIASDPNNQTLLDRKNELVDIQRDLINSIQDEEDAIVSLAKNGYDKLKEALDDIIEKRKEALQTEQSLFEYQNSIDEKTSNIDSLKKQIEARYGDTSEEARADIQKLQVELNDAEKDLEETMYDKWVNDQEQMLDKFSSDTEEWINERLGDTNGILSEIRDAVTSSGSIDDVLKSLSDEWGFELSPEMLNILSSNSNIDVTSAIAEIKSISDMAEQSVNISNDVSQILNLLKSQTFSTASTASNQYGVSLKGYAVGSKRIPYNQLAITQEKGQELILSPSENGILTKLQKGDSVLTNEMTNRLWELAQGNIPFGVVQPQVNLPVVEPKSQNNNITIDLGNITLPNVKNYEQFKDALIRDSSFEKSIKSIALDKAFGRNSLNKLRY